MTSLRGLHQKIAYRLGLSATPVREYDEEGTGFICAEMGPVRFTFGLKEAIERGILVEFDYVPLSYSLSLDDRARLKAVYNKKAARDREGSSMSKEELWTELSRVYKTAEYKPAVFQDYLKDHPEVVKNTIVFVEETAYGARVLPMIHRATPSYRTYYSGEDKAHLIAFSKGEIDCLITCHRISQGIDIQRLRNVILFSSARAKLETIQRIGRCLRYDPAKPDKRALVVDFIRDGEGNAGLESADSEREQWLSDLSKVKRIENDGN
jgi:superfamily II DNA or RNA helicase